MSRSDQIQRLNEALQGRYEISRDLGEGGMAMVYLATDLRHNRQVALKVLKPELAAVVGAERFLAEIETTANLQHPHILPLFDSGEVGGVLFYVMPYVDGETLADRLAREKQLPVDEAVRIASAVGNALQAAHEAGVVHRDIKPGNILLSRGEPLIADFGIALAVGTGGGGRLTETGLSLGTPFYMSPEQATGESYIGPAADIYALGCVLYEMLVGEPPHIGNSAQAVLGKIIQGAPVAATTRRKTVPPHVDHALRKALETLPADRFASAEQFVRALADPGFRHGTGEEVGGVAEASGRGQAKWIALSVTLAALATWAFLRPDPSLPRPYYEFEQELEEPIPAGFLPGAMALAPDGVSLVRVGPGPNGVDQDLRVQRFDGTATRVIEGTEGASYPSVSPEGDRVAFVRNPGRTLEVAPWEGGRAQVLADSVGCCVHWGRDGFIYFLLNTETGPTVMRTSPDGAVEAVLEPTPGKEYGDVSVTRSGETLLTYLWDRGSGVSAILATRIADGVSSEILPGAQSRVHHLPTGHLLYVDAESQLKAVAFDEGSLEVTGPSTVLADDVRWADAYNFASSDEGTVVYFRTFELGPEVRPVWVDRNGVMEPVDPSWDVAYRATSGDRGFALSPDGTRVAISVYSRLGVNGDIWVKRLPDGAFSPVTSTPEEDTRPRWTPEGDSIVFLRTGTGRYSVMQTRADGVADPIALLPGLTVAEFYPSRVGEYAAVRMGRSSDLSMNLAAVRISDGEIVSSTDTEFLERSISLSPNGRWLAYESDRTGGTEVYIRSFPDLSERHEPVSSAGGMSPVWSPRGDELFYLNGARQMVSVPVDAAEDLVIGREQVLFDVPDGLLTNPDDYYAQYEPDQDGRRFMMLLAPGASDAPRLAILLNAFSLLDGRD